MARLTICEKPEDYAAFIRVVGEAWEIVFLPIYAMLAMPNHWHFVVWPETSDQVSEFFRRLTVMHTMRWRAHDKTGGAGHLYQGRFKYLTTLFRPFISRVASASSIEKSPSTAFNSNSSSWPCGVRRNALAARSRRCEVFLRLAKRSFEDVRSQAGAWERV